MKILFVTLSNIGDVITTLPVLDALKSRFPEAKITVLTGPRPREIFENNPAIEKVIIYDKHSRLREKVKMFLNLRKENFSVIVDLRNSLLGALLPAKYKTSLFTRVPRRLKHVVSRHLYRASRAVKDLDTRVLLRSKSINITDSDQKHMLDILSNHSIGDSDKIIIIAPGARSHTKIWPKERFSEIIPILGSRYSAKIFLVGDKRDKDTIDYIASHSRYPVADISSKTSIGELAYLLKKACLVISNDSAIQHLASYLDRPVVSLFGPTDNDRYGSWSSKSLSLRKEVFCRPCRKAQCRFNTLECLSLIGIQDLLASVEDILNIVDRNLKQRQYFPELKRILIARTDRIGDVILSTPVISAVRKAYPFAYISFLVSPAAQEILQDNPFLDQVILMDKERQHKGIFGFLKLASYLRKHKFDLAIILHPTLRIHLLSFVSGIPLRVGYGRKGSFLLNKKIKHSKHLGEKHEREYNLDLINQLGIPIPKESGLFMPIRKDSEEWLDNILRANRINRNDRLIVIHPGASCPSKIWPNGRFAELADRLIQDYGVKVVLVCGSHDTRLTQEISGKMHNKSVNLGGKTSLSELASLLKRSSLFISNDSGPVHIAAALDVPVISIFGRKQRGLSPARWGPLGKKSFFVHGDAGCLECLAHNCKRDFACLKAITVKDVFDLSEKILNNQEQQ